MKLFATRNTIARNQDATRNQNPFAKNCMRIALATTSIIVLGAGAAGCATSLRIGLDIPQQLRQSDPVPPQSRQDVRQPKDTSMTLLIREQPPGSNDTPVKLNAVVAFQLAQNSADKRYALLVSFPVVDRLLEDIVRVAQ